MRAPFLVLLFSLAFTCAACSAIVPASQADLDAMSEAGHVYTEASIRQAANGNEATSFVYAGMAGVTAILATIGASRRRRTLAALKDVTGSDKVPSLQPSIPLG